MAVSGGDYNTMLLLHGEDLADSSLYQVPVTNSGVVVSADQSKFGGKSMYFNGTSHLVANNAAFLPKHGDFTIDWWEYRISSGDLGGVFCQSNTPGAGIGFLLGYMAQGTPRFYMSSGSPTWDVFADVIMGTLRLNQWTHRALVRTGSTFLLFENGVQTWSGTYAGELGSYAGETTIGQYDFPGGYSYFPGYIDEFRISNVARWTENFTPPTEPYEVLPPTISTPENFAAQYGENFVALAWDPVEEATGYRLYRDGILIATLTEPDYTDTMVEPFTAYVYSLTAYDEDTESEPATLEVEIILPPAAPVLTATPSGVRGILLEWTEVLGADGYRLTRDGLEVADTTDTSYLDAELGLKESYTYTLTAYNTAGSSASAPVTAETTGLVLITDRTPADVESLADLLSRDPAAWTAAELDLFNRAASKGAYNHTDLNRVTEAVEVLVSMLHGMGYEVAYMQVLVQPGRTIWRESDDPNADQMAGYLENVLQVYIRLLEEPVLPDPMDRLTFQGANQIEAALLAVDDAIRRMLLNTFYSGEIYCGEV